MYSVYHIPPLPSNGKCSESRQIIPAAPVYSVKNASKLHFLESGRHPFAAVPRDVNFSRNSKTAVSHNTTEVVCVKWRLLAFLLILALLAVPASGAEDYIKWVDFNVSYEAMDKALALPLKFCSRNVIQI